MIVGVAAGANGTLIESSLIAACLGILAMVIPRDETRLALAALAGFVAGAVAGEVRSLSDQPDGSPAIGVVEATITTDPRLIQTGQIAGIAWIDSTGTSGDSLVILSSTLDVGRGDRITFRSAEPSSGDFVFADETVVVHTAGGLENVRRTIRESASARLLDRLPGSTGSLSLGLLIGDDSGFTEREREQVRASGLSHLTAVSGSNVTLVVAVLAFVLRASNKRSWRWIATLVIGIVGYGWIVGAEPPIVRAAIMGSLALVATAVGRPAHLLTLLFLAGGLMAAHDPSILSTLSFQLSFLAMAGLTVAGPLMAGRRSVRQRLLVAVLSPAAAAIATAPLLAGRFGTFGTGTILANMVVAPIIAPATLLSAGVAIMPDNLYVGRIIAVPLWFMTNAVLSIAQVVAELPYSQIVFDPLPSRQIAAIYAVLLVSCVPVIPEARYAMFRLSLWFRREPAVAAVATLSSLATVIIGALIVD